MYPHLLANRYELLHRIGVGGMAQVYLARDTLLGREVAVKILRETGAQDPAFVERFRREARAAAGLNHPNVVTIYDGGEAATDAGDPLYYLIMEYVPGRNLKEVLLARGPLPEIEALDIAQQIASALAAAHARDLIHRDVKPHNVLIDPSGRAKVVDFGIAYAAGLSQLTTTNAVSGTAHYLSPEQAERRPLDARSDLYSLGVVLYEMMTGRVPFDGDTLVDVALQHLREPPTPPRQLRKDISPESEAIVLTALSKDPAGRFASATEMEEALRRAHDRLHAADPPVPGGTACAGFAAAEDTAVVSGPATAQLGSLSLAPRPRLRKTSPERASWRMGVPVFVLLAGIGAVFVFARSTATTGHHAQAALPTHTATPAHLASHLRPTATPHPATLPHRTPEPTAAATSTAQPRPIPTSTRPAPAATTAPTTPEVAQAGPGGADPSRAVAAFYERVAQHDFASAAQLWTSGMLARFPPAANIDDRFGRVQSVVLRRDETTERSSTAAVVAIDVVLLFPTTVQEYAGTWALASSARLAAGSTEPVCGVHRASRLPGTRTQRTRT
jgi:serine/threonine-protein kinase